MKQFNILGQAVNIIRFENCVVNMHGPLLEVRSVIVEHAEGAIYRVELS